jgi:hypothetical protein
MASANRIEGIGGGGRGPGGYSYRSSELTAAERRALKKQNKAAESLKNKDLDKMDKNKAAYAKQKAARAEQLKGAYKVGKKVGATAGLAGGVVVGAVAQKAVDKAKSKTKPKGSVAKTFDVKKLKKAGKK